MGKDVRVAFGQRVRRRRTALGVTQEELAHASGLHRNYVGGIERGERNPSLENIARLAAALRITPAWLVATVGTPAVRKARAGR